MKFDASNSIDVVISAYNRPDALLRALKSVQAQEYPNWQCYVCEDGSSGEIKEVTDQFIADKRIHYLPGSHLGFPAPARNRGIASGNGELIAFLDDDDQWQPDKLAIQVEYMEKHRDCVLHCSNAFNWTQAKKQPEESSTYFASEFKAGNIAYKDLLAVNKIICSSAIVKRNVISLIGPFNEDSRLAAYEDYELWLRCGLLGKIYYDSQPLVVYANFSPQSIRTGVDETENKSRLAAVYRSVLEFLEADELGIGERKKYRDFLQARISTINNPEQTEKTSILQRACCKLLSIYENITHR